MADYNFKNLSDVEVVEAVPDGANIFGVNNGAIFQAPAASMTSTPMIIDPSSSDFKSDDTTYGNNIKDALLKGTPIWIYTATSSASAGETWRYAPVAAFQLYRSSQGACSLVLYYHDKGTDGVLKQQFLAITITI